MGASRRGSGVTTDGRHPASVDELTGLGSRVGLLSTALDRPASGPGLIALYLIDIDRFMAVNDVGGRPLGDAMLRAYADRLRDWSVPGVGPFADHAGIRAARVDEDRFAVVAGGFVDEADVLDRARTLRHDLRRIVRLGDEQISRAPTVGIAVDERADADVADLLARAEDAVRVAKADGRPFELYQPALREGLRASARLDLDLSTAVERGQLRLEYQPEVDLGTGAVLATEALVRWQHPTLGLLGPDTFIVAAERTGIIAELDEWVLREACRQRAVWDAALPTKARAEQVMRVNVSPRSLVGSVGLPADAIGRIVGEAGLDPRRLCLELTEHAVPTDTGALRESCARLRAIGITIALDDFGTGFSSIPHLKTLPADVLKVDQTFVAGLGRGDVGDDAIVASFVRLARAFGLHVVAEGVQTDRQAEALLALGCHRGQGHLIGEAGPAAVIEAMLRAGSIGRHWRPAPDVG